MLFAVPQVLYILGGLVFLAFGVLLIGGPLAFRIRGIKTSGKIIAVKAVGGHGPVVETPSENVSPEDDEPLGRYFLKHPGVFLFVAVFFFTFVVVPFGFVGVGSYIAFSHIGLVDNGIRALAQVEYIAYEKKKQEVRYGVLSFEDLAGKERKVREVIGIGGLPEVKSGDQLDIYYSPDDQEGVIADDIVHYMKLPAILNLIGLVILMLVSLFSGSSKKGGHAAFNGELYYPIFEYKTPAGERIQTASYAGSASLGDKIPGTPVTLGRS